MTDLFFNTGKKGLMFIMLLMLALASLIGLVVSGDALMLVPPPEPALAVLVIATFAAIAAKTFLPSYGESKQLGFYAKDRQLKALAVPIVSLATLYLFGFNTEILKQLSLSSLALSSVLVGLALCFSYEPIKLLYGHDKSSHNYLVVGYSWILGAGFSISLCILDVGFLGSMNLGESALLGLAYAMVGNSIYDTKIIRYFFSFLGKK